MKTLNRFVATFAISIAALAPCSFAQLSIPSDGSDGTLIISSNTVIDLSQAVTGSWTNNNLANAGKGVYDPTKWAVVFKYSSVVVSNGATVSFKNHPTHAPVVWLVNGSVSISGTLSLDGNSYNSGGFYLAEPGPGGFRGGAQYNGSYGLSSSGGFGPGGYSGDFGSYSTYHPYGNPQVLPLIGGSGGAGKNYNGAAGGGAILIAAANQLTVNGQITSNGGSGYNYYDWYAFHGSGGAIRLIADQILGSGNLQATGYYPGRIRLEANSASTTLTIDPLSAAASPNPVMIWPAANAPTASVISVAGQAAPLDPKAALNGAAADLTIPNTNTVTITVQTTYFPTNGTVNVYVKPRNSAQSILPANYVSGNTSNAIWQVNTTLPAGHNIIQVRAVAN